MSSSLKPRTVHALSWSFLEAVGLRATQFIFGIILARILFPEQFGLIAMLSIFIAVSQSFLDSGFGDALVQKRDISQIDACSIFYFNIFIGVVAAGLLYFISPWISAFYKQPILTWLMRALSLTLVINSFGLVQAATLTKAVNFKTRAKVSLIASIISGSIGVTLAIIGFGVWSLVVQQLSNALVRTTCLWFFSSWRPALIFSLNSLRSMFRFGSRLLLSGLLNQIFENIYLIVVGKLFSAGDLGFFSRARALQETPTSTLSDMVGRVTFPVFSTIQDDPARLKRGLKKALTLLVMVNFPIMIGIAVVARPLVLVILTDKWAGCISYLRLFCIYGLLYPVHAINLNILMAMGRSDLFLRLEIIKKLLVIINIAVTWRWGISAMIYGMSIISCIAYYLNSYYTGKLLGYKMREQIKDFSPYFLMSMVMGLLLFIVGQIPLPYHWFMLLLQVLIGIIIYMLLCRFFRLPAFMEAWNDGWNKIALLKNRRRGGINA